MKRIGQHAVVIGASMGGLLAARTLADFFDMVTLIERDTFPAPGEQRKGVPQGKHAHGLHSRGREILEELYPGITEELVAQGGVTASVGERVRWFSSGDFLQTAETDLIGLLVSRPRMEAQVRIRTLALPNVRAFERCDVAGLMTTADRERVTGVRITHKESGDSEALEADLVVDASGRGTRGPAWLAALGYEKPQEEEVRINLGYVTREYRRPAFAGHENVAIIIAGDPPSGRSGVLLAQEDDRWILTVAGYEGDHASLDPQEFTEYVKNLPTPDIYEAIKDAEPLSAPRAFKYPSSLWRHYEKMARLPKGYLAFGDAICSFNPVYGQGMTVASLEAIALRECLAGGAEGLAQRFFKQASKIIATPWSVAVGNDLRLPQIEGKRTPMLNFINWYIVKLQLAAHHDGSLTIAFLRVLNMIDAPPGLLKPSIAWRVLRGNLRRRTKAAPASAPAMAAPAASS